MTANQSDGKRSPDTLRADRARFAAKLRAARAVLGWSQTVFGQKAGLTQRSVYRLENADVDPKRSTRLAIEAILTRAGVRFEDAADGGFKIMVEGGSLNTEGSA